MANNSIDTIDSIFKIIQSVAIVIGIWFTYQEYKRFNDKKIEEEKERIAQAAKEIRMHFYQLQLDYYTEAVDATATLATENKGTEDYINSRKKFMRLFWGRLAIVEESTVEAKMIEFKDLLELYENAEDNVTKDQLEQASLELAHAASRYTISVWVDSKERSNYNR